jgi:hypothetical protein
MTTKGTTSAARYKTNPMAPYFVQMREFERRLIREAHETTGGDIALTAEVLGVRVHYVKARAKLLGGVFGDAPKNEPPGLAAEAWQATSPSGARRRKAKAKAQTTESVDA